MTKKILAFAMMLLIALSLTGCFSLFNRSTVNYDTLEELQEECSGFYFFDFGTDFTMTSPYVLGVSFDKGSCDRISNYVKEGYDYLLGTETEDDRSVTLSICVRKTFYNSVEERFDDAETNELYIREYKIDGITSRLFYLQRWDVIAGTELLFWIEDMICQIILIEMIHSNESYEQLKKVTTDYSIAVAEAAIFSRYKV